MEMSKLNKLKQEAKENSFRYTLDKPWVCEIERKQIMTHFEKGYLVSAEPREKKIEELEQQIEIERNSRIALVNKITELEKQNAGLKARLNAINLLTPELEKSSKLKTQQLTKATELLKEAQGYIENEDDELYDKIEQFIKEIEK